ncbi:hypothetical protein [Gloeobacter kilaueensis]|uniref:Uncharacterized protein n=1 Tax=Gloeobacter kilaueensis (strain ATCC BAA-2537 / CCAP 1431/1 / ULC 316 / JS1) TaxID=1183438 RepID=U5QHP2_GLOK1|nr:hypothetical protein [Gloeobacter kilaueensis]AGY57149.1 hypothetical protein GKIL_0903 [Gloeobacter kilaueensis JS1]
MSDQELLLSLLSRDEPRTLQHLDAALPADHRLKDNTFALRWALKSLEQQNKVLQVMGVAVPDGSYFTYGYLPAIELPEPEPAAPEQEATHEEKHDAAD